jgi:hypothetical protein
VDRTPQRPAAQPRAGNAIVTLDHGYCGGSADRSAWIMPKTRPPGSAHDENHPMLGTGTRRSRTRPPLRSTKATIFCKSSTGTTSTDMGAVAIAVSASAAMPPSMPCSSSDPAWIRKYPGANRVRPSKHGREEAPSLCDIADSQVEVTRLHSLFLLGKEVYSQCSTLRRPTDARGSAAAAP